MTSPGTYVVAVSGGVDSVALLHALHSKNQGLSDKPWKLVVAHLDHGIRPDSAEDRKLVQQLAEKWRLPFVYEEAHLGPGASEAAARQVRYGFLRRVQQKYKARAIVTAHHQDDVLETAVINLLRGSGRKGLASLSSQKDVERPLLHTPKKDLIAYAKEQKLQWREDSTNQNTDYLRNYVRHRLLSQFDNAARSEMLEIINNMRQTNQTIDNLLLQELEAQSGQNELDRAWFTLLPHAVAKETMAAWLRSRQLRNFDSKTLERLVVAAKVAAPGKTFDVMHKQRLAVGADSLALVGPER